MRGRGPQRRGHREQRLRLIGVPPGESAPILRHLGDTVLEAFGDVRGVIGSRLRRRGVTTISPDVG